MEACGHVSDGLESALEIVMNIKNSNIRKMNASKTSIVKSCRILRDCVRCIHLKMEQCARIVSSFVKRISPRTDDEIAELDYDISMNGAKRSALRKLAGRMKNEGRMTELSWPTSLQVLKLDSADEIDRVTLDHSWIEAVDNALWEKELILLRLNGAVAKKKAAKMLGERIAKELNAHVTQVVGHTTLLYRPGIPPQIKLNNE